VSDPGTDRGATKEHPTPKCPACGAQRWLWLLTAPDMVHRTSGRTFPVLECESCGLGRTELGTEPPEPGSMYPPDYVFHSTLDSNGRRRSSRVSEWVARATGSERYWRWCDSEFADFEELARSPGRALDVGCGAGRYLGRLDALGWDVGGIEPSASAAETARRRGFVVQTSTAEDASYPDRTLDLVTMYHSLEHCERPEVAVGRAIGALKPGGVIAIALCNFDSPGRRFFGPFWPMLELPRHRYHFGPRSVTRLLEGFGARVEGVYYHNDLTVVPAALEYMARRRNRRDERPFPSGTARIGTALTLTYAPLLRLAGLSLRAAFLVRARRD